MSWDDVRRARLWEARRTTAQHSHRPEYQMLALGPLVVINPAANATSNFQWERDDGAGLGGIPTHPMPFSGVVRALTVSGHTALSAGTATFTVTKNGTNQTSPSLAFATGSSFDEVVIERGVLTFEPGDRLGVQVATNAAYAPTAADWIAHIWVEVKSGGQ